MTARFDISRMPPSPDLSVELPLWRAGIYPLAGIDEAGRGAWAGPVSAAAVSLPYDASLMQRLSGVRDSKQMKPEQRTAWAVEIKAVALSWSIGFASNQEIDALGIAPATRLAMARAVAQLCPTPQHLLIDFLLLPAISIPQTPLVKGDARVLSIAAASVLAKTARDALLVDLDVTYPGYGFAAHKGYGTLRHALALQQLGPCPAHRMSFAPLQPVIQSDHQDDFTTHRLVEGL
ncbi:MAG: ribonuclease HII [Anaerolineaceae bacterium]|nr:ribonuclease HII [Anaerolineaceae bacterium]